jgi:hypothetical protein
VDRRTSSQRAGDGAGTLAFARRMRHHGVTVTHLRLHADRLTDAIRVLVGVRVSG